MLDKDELPQALERTNDLKFLSREPELRLVQPPAPQRTQAKPLQ